MAHAPCSYCGSTQGPDHICPGHNLQLLGQVLDGRYRIDDVLGQGGMGMVFRATQMSVQREVALKTLHPALAAAPQFFERFRREAEMASKLHHPNIITIFDFGRAADGTCYYVMEYLEGESLKQLVKREGPLPLGRAVDLALQAARALGHSHESGVIHRDVKPHNIMVQRLDQKDFVKVLDFGLVKAMEQDENQQLTSTGQVLGTPQYMPPEQAGGEVVDHRSDLYSLAGVLYYCLTGSSPYGANTVRKALQASLTQSVPPVGRKRNGAPVPASLDEFLRKGLAREKEDRYQDAEEFVRELEAAVAPATQEQLEAVPLPPDPASSGKEGSGSGSSSRDRGTVASRKPGARSVSRASNVVLAPELERARAGSGSGGRAPSGSGQAGPGGSGAKTAAFVAVPLLLAIGVGGFILFGGGTPAPAQAEVVPVERVEIVDPPPQPTAEAAPAGIKVRFETDPPGAGIYEGDLQIGTTPTDLLMDRGKVLHLSFRLAGHLPAERTLDLSRLAEDRTTVRVALKEKERPRAQPAQEKRRRRPSEDPIPVFE